MIHIVGDRPGDLLESLRFMRDQGMALIITSGGLGPTADDLTTEVVGRFSGREMVLDAALEAKIADILRPLLARWPGLDLDAVMRSNRKQAVIPEGATVLDPVGTAPGLVVPPVDGQGPTVVVLPGPPGELQPMWDTARGTDAFRAAVADATTFVNQVVRLFGIPESEIAATLRAGEEAGLELEPLEITTCLRRGEIEIATRYEPPAQAQYDALLEFIRGRHADTLFSEDGSTIDEQVAGLLAGHTIAVAESCTGGGLASRITDRAGSSEYFLGGVVVYSNEAKVDLAGVDPSLIERFGAVSVEVAEALAYGVRTRFDADIGVGITGVAGPGGGTPEKPVGFVCITVCHRDGRRLTRTPRIPGGRSDVRDRSVTVALHMLRRMLLGETDVPPGSESGSAGGSESAPAGGSDSAPAGGFRGRPRRPDPALVTVERARLFAALELPGAVRAVLAGWTEEQLRELPRLRRVGVDALHATLCFLGSQSVEEIEAIAAACSVAASEPRVALSLAEPRWLPRRRPHVLAVELSDPDGVLSGVQAAVADALVAGGWYERESRPFLAHVTVARVGRGSQLRRAPTLAAPAPLSFEADSVALFRSWLGPGGSRYERLAAVQLSG
jgi:nicotinamide-nucleotide amidase